MGLGWLHEVDTVAEHLGPATGEAGEQSRHPLPEVRGGAGPTAGSSSGCRTPASATQDGLREDLQDRVRVLEGLGRADGVHAVAAQGGTVQLVDGVQHLLPGGARRPRFHRRQTAPGT